MCQAMQWSHLPVAGGIYDQSPKLIDEWAVLFNIQAEVEKEREKKQKAEAKKPRR